MPPKSNGLKRKGDEQKDRRICIVDYEKVKCTPAETNSFRYLRKHARECGKDCIEHDTSKKPPKIVISEFACPACTNRAKRCPDNAVRVVKLPSNLDFGISHRYGPATFRLNGLPTPRIGHVMGILGSNGTGKSTAVGILSGRIKPNLGKVDDPPGWQEIIKYYRGSELQNYFLQLAEDRLSCSVKPQMDSTYTRSLGDITVNKALDDADERECKQALMDKLDLNHIADRHINMLSGGELQRLAIAICLSAEVDVYILDEPSSFLDLKQRLQMSRAVHDVLAERDHKCYIMVIEHDLTVLQLVSNNVCCLYGDPGAYGVVTQRAGVRRGINSFLAGFLPAENMRFRQEALTFWASAPQDIEGGGDGDGDGAAKPISEEKRVVDQAGADKKAKEKKEMPEGFGMREYPEMIKVHMPKKKTKKVDKTNIAAIEAEMIKLMTEYAPDKVGNVAFLMDKFKGREDKLLKQFKSKYGIAEEVEEAEEVGPDGQAIKPAFKLTVESGSYYEQGQVIVLLGENGTGKSTFIDMFSHWLTTGKADGGSDDRNTGGADNGGSKEGKGFVAIKRQHPLERARRVWNGSVKRFLEASPAGQSVHNRMFRLLVLKALRVEELMDLPLKSLSGGELQRLAVVVCLGTPAEIFLLDEPSAALDCEQRVAVAKVIKRWVVSFLHKTAFVVEHDFAMATILADRVVVFSGTPGVDCRAAAPQAVESGFNTILKQLGATMRLDPENGRPLVNKFESTADREQKKAGQYYQFDLDAVVQDDAY